MTISDELQANVRQFKAHCKEYEQCRWNDKVSVIMIERLEPAGRAVHSFRGDIVYIDRILWPDLSWCQREVLVFHELGHMILGLGHSDLESSIMYESLDPIDCDIYEMQRGMLIDELFTGEISSR